MSCVQHPDTADQISGHGGDGCAPGAHTENRYQNGIQQDIHQIAGNGSDDSIFGISVSPDGVAHGASHQHPGSSDGHDCQIISGIGSRLGIGTQQRQQSGHSGKERNQNDGTQEQGRVNNKSRIFSAFTEAFFQ